MTKAYICVYLGHWLPTKGWYETQLLNVVAPMWIEDKYAFWRDSQANGREWVVLELLYKVQVRVKGVLVVGELRTERKLSSGLAILAVLGVETW